MCGLAGIMMHDGAPDVRLLEVMVGTMGHRGPDSTGRCDLGETIMGHSRLAIIDLESGDQPLFDRRGTALVANGEIYNYIELRHSLGEARFQTRSDCEPPLLMYELNGAAFAQPLRGMFAIAIGDPHNGHVQLARDPFGIKPLYYTEFDGGVAFASEANALMASGLVPRTLNTASRDELLQLQFTTGRDTVFEGIRRVLPGETITLEKGRLTHHMRRAALADTPPMDWSEDEALRKLDEALMDSVMVHQRSDVSYGMFLSGGVDSSAILACMRELNDQPVEAFTAGFSGTKVVDERKHAEAVAKAAGANHHCVEFSEADFWKLLPEIVSFLDDPTADYAVLPTYKLGQLVKEAGLKVVLSGEGGDELFAGYGRYRKLLRPWWLGGRPMRQKGSFDGLGVLRNDEDTWRENFKNLQERENFGRRTKLQVAQAVDCADWLPHDLLIKLDRCLMAHSVEGRTPMLDPKVAALAMQLPDKLKIRGGQGKYLLRRWLETKLPEARPFERKQGFTVPVAEWIGRRGAETGKLVAAKEAIWEIADPAKVESLFAGLERDSSGQNGQAAWRLLFYALWHKRHIEDVKLEGDVFAALS